MVFGPIGSHRAISDIFDLENIVQQTGIVHGKNILVDTLRDIFSHDRQYKYVSDVFGFPKTPSHLGLNPEAGLDDEETTRIFIGTAYRYDIKFNPSIIVRSTGTRYVPISFNQNRLNTLYRKELIMDGYGNKAVVNTPYAYTQVGAWDQTFEVKIIAENEMDREEITDIVSSALMMTRRIDLERAGLHIKDVSTSAETETQYANDHLYMISVNVSARSEFKTSIPIHDVCERIGICLTFRTLPDGPVADGLTINEQITQADLL